MKRVAIERIDADAGIRASVSRALEWIRAGEIIRQDTRVFVKPNLTWKAPTPGVTTTPAALRALVEELRALTPHITVGESNGGQDCFWAEDAFESHGLYDLVSEYGIQVLNLSKQPTETVSTTVRGQEISVEMPSVLVRSTDVFITMPVPKIHAMTRVSMTFKNQWGCLGNSMRVTEHPRFPELIVAINKLLPRKLAVCDGTYFMDQTGPLIGNPVPMNLIVASDDIGAAALACCAIMQIDPRTVRHFRVAHAEGIFPSSINELTLNQPLAPFQTHQFRLRRSPINYIHLAAFQNRLLNRMFYDSATADLLHEVLWFIRRNPLVKQLLYGRYGPGEANRHGAY